MPDDVCVYCLEIIDEEVGPCVSCNGIFCSETCMDHHFEVGEHFGGGYFNDGIYRPLVGPYSYMNDGEGKWIPAQELESWGNWRRLY